MENSFIKLTKLPSSIDAAKDTPIWINVNNLVGMGSGESGSWIVTIQTEGETWVVETPEEILAKIEEL